MIGLNGCNRRFGTIYDTPTVVVDEVEVDVEDDVEVDVLVDVEDDELVEELVDDDVDDELDVEEEVLVEDDVDEEVDVDEDVEDDVEVDDEVLVEEEVVDEEVNVVGGVVVVDEDEEVEVLVDVLVEVDVEVDVELLVEEVDEDVDVEVDVEVLVEVDVEVDVEVLVEDVVVVSAVSAYDIPFPELYNSVISAPVSTRLQTATSSRRPFMYRLIPAKAPRLKAPAELFMSFTAASVTEPTEEPLTNHSPFVRDDLNV